MTPLLTVLDDADHSHMARAADRVREESMDGFGWTFFWTISDPVQHGPAPRESS
jgi:hypothetical protein